MAVPSQQAYQSRLQDVARLRLIVGFLGEKGQHAWWPTEFYSKTAAAFLSPVFVKTAALAQYHGVKEAARREHDDRIGVGRVFHLFRLPESMEQSLFELLNDPALVSKLAGPVESQAAAMAALEDMAKTSAPFREGPLQIGTAADLDGSRWLTEAARSYAAAFKADARCFPYLLDEA